MRRVALSLLFVCLTTTAFAQTELDVAERNRLRELLRISATSEFSQQLKTPLPAQNSYQIFLGFGLDFETHNNFVRWLEEWNRKPATRYGKLVVTEDIQQAQIILARFPGDETVLDVTSYAMKADNGVYDKAGTKREHYTTIFSYVLLPLKNSPLHLQAVWRNQLQVKQNAKEKQLSENGYEAGWKLRNALFDLLKRGNKRLR
jgi:hypothetical protein